MRNTHRETLRVPQAKRLSRAVHAVLLASVVALPLQAVEPKEGAAALMVTMCPVVDSDMPAQAQKFSQHMLSPEIQKVFAKAGYGPVNRKTELTEQEKEGLAVGDEAVGKLARIDWPTVNQNRAAWTQRWNREVER